LLGSNKVREKDGKAQDYYQGCFGKGVDREGEKEKYEKLFRNPKDRGGVPMFGIKKVRLKLQW